MNQTQSLFLQNTVLAAQQADREVGIPASVTIAQATLESRWGQSACARQANNYFGIKATDVLNPDHYIEFETEEVVAGRTVQVDAKFARYPSPMDSFKAHARLLSSALRYRPAMAVKTDPAKFAEQLQECGYSTNPNYGNLLMQIVREFDLTQYDIPPGSPAEAKEVAA